MLETLYKSQFCAAIVKLFLCVSFSQIKLMDSLSLEWQKRINLDQSEPRNSIKRVSFISFGPILTQLSPSKLCFLDPVHPYGLWARMKYTKILLYIHHIHKKRLPFPKILQRLWLPIQQKSFIHLPLLLQLTAMCYFRRGNIFIWWVHMVYKLWVYLSVRRIIVHHQTLHSFDIKRKITAYASKNNLNTKLKLCFSHLVSIFQIFKQLALGLRSWLHNKTIFLV